MRVLVVEDTIGSSTDVVLDLAAAGHHVLRCQPIGAEVTPCAGFATPRGTCPLTAPADVVVQVHDTDELLTMRELGLVCAARAGAAVVNVGGAESRAATLSTTPDRLLDVLGTLAASTAR